MQIEETPAGVPDEPVRRDELAYRLKQQRLLAEFGRMALRESDLPALLQRATELCADGLDAPFCKALEFLHDRRVLLMRAGVGWRPEEIGQATLGADLESPAGFAFQTGQPVLSNHLTEETRFRTPTLLAAYGIRRAVNVLIDLGGKNDGPFGVLEVDSPDPGDFDEDDVTFLYGCARILGAAIERNRSDTKLQKAVERQAMLMREMSHRIKNSLGVVSGLLRINASNVADPAAKALLQDAENRVLTIAHVHNHLWQGERIGEVNIGEFLRELCKSLGGSVEGVTIGCEADDVVIDADFAIPVGLMVNELVTNAVKYAFDPGGPGAVAVRLTASEQELSLRVEDDGRGLPPEFDLNASRKSFGIRVITSLARQLQGELQAENLPRGCRFSLVFPRHKPEQDGSDG